MGAEAAKAVLRHGRAIVVGGLLAVALAAVVAPAGWAADPTPSPTPTSPSVSPPSQQQIDDAKNALERLRNHDRSRGTATPAARPSQTISEVAGPVAGPKRPPLPARISDQAWWTIAAGVLVLVVASEATRLRVRRAKHRRRT
jgi:hypothetical protein